jgi:flagellar basal-body rod modification protein FlgD
MNVTQAAQTMGKDEFLKLFTYQLRYQDPMKPLESTEFTSQLAQFSSLEQLYNLNTGITQLLSFQSSINNGMVAGFIGKSVITQDGSTGKIVGISFDQGNTFLTLDNGKKITIGDIKEIFMPQA